MRYPLVVANTKHAFCDSIIKTSDFLTSLYSNEQYTTYEININVYVKPRNTFKHRRQSVIYIRKYVSGVVIIL